MKGTGRSRRRSRPVLPQVKNRAWCRNPIDFFILAKLEANGLEPSPEAARTTLLKRLSLDLVGLPPAISEANGFLADRRDDAHARQVERLLDSPHYGERWGRIWLDAARYADSDGYEKDKSRQVYFYRDWVVGRAEPRPALRRVHHRADRRRPDPERHRRTR